VGQFVGGGGDLWFDEVEHAGGKYVNSSPEASGIIGSRGLHSDGVIYAKGSGANANSGRRHKGARPVKPEDKFPPEKRGKQWPPAGCPAT
jgi:hypothetical protein